MRQFLPWLWVLSTQVLVAVLFAAPIQLPVEVIGADGYTEAVSYEVAAPSDVDGLWLQVHRPGYRDDSTAHARGPKASLRLNGGTWIPLTNDTVELHPSDAAVGGIGGGHHTVRMIVPLSGVRSGANTIEFRFNGTDGFTGGFRVLDLEFRRGGFSGGGEPPANGKAVADPTLWQPPFADSASIEAGRLLWSGGELLESPVNPVAINASCASCHALDGRDLKYFNYSNWSIEERSKFHGMSPLEAAQVASYIRSLDVPAPAHARPWNPPYQPGPGLDSRPVEEWAAGAGLDAVLDTDDEMRPFLFPGGSNTGVQKAATLNVREMPVAMQFPDWNDWLPEVAPEDVWGDYFFTTLFDDADGDTRGDLMGHYLKLLEQLDSVGPDRLVEKGDLEKFLERYILSGIKYFLDSRFHDAEALIPNSMLPEVGYRSVRHWTVVRLWEIQQEYGLEDRAVDVYGAAGEARSWLGQARSVFDLAPHLAADNGLNFQHQSFLVGKYQSTAWYQLQMTVNAGNRNGIAIAPVDWNYQPNHVNDLYAQAGGPMHFYRQVQTWAKLLQSFSGPNNLSAGDFREEEPFVRQLHPARWFSMGVLADYPDPIERGRVFAVMLEQYMDALESIDRSNWERNDGKAGRWETDLYTPSILGGSFNNNLHKGNYADSWYAMIPELAEWGLPPQLLQRMQSWGAQMWPLADWSVYDAITGYSPFPLVSGRGLYFEAEATQ